MWFLTASLSWRGKEEYRGEKNGEKGPLERNRERPVKLARLCVCVGGSVCSVLVPLEHPALLTSSLPILLTH